MDRVFRIIDASQVKLLIETPQLIDMLLQLMLEVFVDWKEERWSTLVVLNITWEDDLILFLLIVVSDVEVFLGAFPRGDLLLIVIKLCVVLSDCFQLSNARVYIKGVI